jgi:hypothetical protein
LIEEFLMHSNSNRRIYWFQRSNETTFYLKIGETSLRMLYYFYISSQSTSSHFQNTIGLSLSQYWKLNINLNSIQNFMLRKEISRSSTSFSARSVTNKIEIHYAMYMSDKNKIHKTGINSPATGLQIYSFYECWSQ